MTGKPALHQGRDEALSSFTTSIGLLDNCSITSSTITKSIVNVAFGSNLGSSRRYSASCSYPNSASAVVYFIGPVSQDPITISDAAYDTNLFTTVTPRIRVDL